jgi:hypothetical protein
MNLRTTAILAVALSLAGCTAIGCTASVRHEKGSLLTSSYDQELHGAPLAPDATLTAAVWSATFEGLARDPESRRLASKLFGGPTALELVAGDLEEKRATFEAPAPEEAKCVVRFHAGTATVTSGVAGHVELKGRLSVSCVTRDEPEDPSVDGLVRVGRRWRVVDLLVEDWFLRNVPGWCVFRNYAQIPPHDPVEHRRDLDARIEAAAAELRDPRRE